MCDKVGKKIAHDKKDHEKFMQGKKMKISFPLSHFLMLPL